MNMCKIEPKKVLFFHLDNFGPSRVRALPLAAGINAGGHYCQAQPKIQLSWADLALILTYPASARPPD